MSELSDSNYIRINIINWVLSIPVVILFSWPYYYAAKLLGMQETFRYLGALLFALPFMITIVHGHVTMALGSVHRDHYYHWLNEHPYTYGLFFSQTFVKTRFRLVLLMISLLFLPVGYLLGI